MPQGTLSVSPVEAHRDADAAGIICNVVQNVEALMPVSQAMRARVLEIIDDRDGKPQ
jgi:hypothetical protein